MRKFYGSLGAYGVYLAQDSMWTGLKEEWDGDERCRLKRKEHEIRKTIQIIHKTASQGCEQCCSSPASFFYLDYTPCLGIWEVVLDWDQYCAKSATGDDHEISNSWAKGDN